MSLAIVTGGSRGIGAAIVKKLAAEGYDVVINCVSNVAKAEAVAKDQTKDMNNGVVKFNFKHILSHVVFKAQTEYDNMDSVETYPSLPAQQYGPWSAQPLQDTFRLLFHQKASAHRCDRRGAIRGAPYRPAPSG